MRGIKTPQQDFGLKMQGSLCARGGGGGGGGGVGGVGLYLWDTTVIQFEPLKSGHLSTPNNRH